MLKELWSALKRQWNEWCILRWWTRKRAAHYSAVEDPVLFPKLAEIMYLNQVGLRGIVVYYGVAKIRLFGHTESCQYSIRLAGVNVLADVDLMPFWEDLRLMNGDIWQDMSTNDITVHYPMRGISDTMITPHDIHVNKLGTRIILVTSRVMEDAPINLHIKLMMEYFMNLQLDGIRVADVPITDRVYIATTDVQQLQGRIETIRNEWMCRPSPEDTRAESQSLAVPELEQKPKEEEATDNDTVDVN